MAVSKYESNGKCFYQVHVKIRINGKQINRKKKNLSSLALAKREESKLNLELLQLKEFKNHYTWSSWSNLCLEKIRIEYRPSTYMGYQSLFNKWVTPQIGDLKLDSISPSIIHDLIFNRITGVGNESRKGVLKCIKRIFNMAVEDGILTRNPATAVKVKSSEVKKLVLNKNEIDILLYEAKKQDHAFYNHWVLALLTGMRNGELYALQWSDVDLESGYISINKSWSIKNGFGPTKNSQNRVCPISKTLREFLISIKTEMSVPQDPVLERCPAWNCGIQAEILRDFCKSIGISSIKFHDLRATFITQLLLKGVPVAKVMKIVGHSDLKTTMVYVRLVGNDLKGVTDELSIQLPSFETSGNVISLFN